MARRATAVAGHGGDPGNALREHLLDVAASLLADRTVSSITTRELARVAGVSEGVLYNYFADKNDLLLTALVRRFTELVARLQAEAPVPGVATVAENLETFAARLLEFHVDARPLFVKLIAEPALLARFVRAIHSPELPLGGRQVRDPLVTYLVGEHQLGRVGSIDTGAAADLLLGSIAVSALTGVPTPIPALVETLLSGLRPTP